MHKLFRISRRRHQPMQLYIKAGFSQPVQASFFLVCVGDSMSTGYRPHVMPRPGLQIDNDIWQCVNSI